MKVDVICPIAPAPRKPKMDLTAWQLFARAFSFFVRSFRNISQLKGKHLITSDDLCDLKK